MFVKKEPSNFKGYKKNQKKIQKIKTNRINIFLKIILIFCLVVIVFLSMLFFSNSIEKNKKVLVCGDGTFYDTCSLNNPYFCENGILVENSSICGCPENYSKSEKGCLFLNKSKGVERTFNYILRGETGQIKFIVYPEITDHLSTFSRSIDYEDEESPQRSDFKFIKINDPLQKNALIPLIVAIQNIAPNSTLDQVRIATSLVQNIPYGEPEMQRIFGYSVRISRYPYQILEEFRGSCEGKSELLVLILRELGYGTSFIYYPLQNHEAVGIKCPIEKSLGGSGYCFIETTVPVPISYSTGNYLGLSGGRLNTEPKIILISKGASLENDLYEYSDAKKLSNILDKNDRLNFFEIKILDLLRKKYGLIY